MRYLTLNDVLELYRQVIERSGGTMGIRDLGLLESALAQPRITFGGELYPTLDEQETVILQVASGEMGRAEFTDWLSAHVVEQSC